MSAIRAGRGGLRATIPQAARHLFEGKDFAHLATLNADGWPQASAVWIGLEGDLVTFNTTRGYLKERNVRRDGRVAISIAAQDDPYENLVIKGKVVEVTTEGADEHIDSLSRRYLDVDSYPWRRADEERVIVRINPERVRHDKY